MRPIALDMHGFASFREEAHVDFGDAEFFALVGPTGSGKSTVIDAMTFALYGSVPRWDDRRTVSLGLAPTASRGPVRLPFEQCCTCVVLPQGDFAQFLHAKPADRQKTLTRILGLGVYERIAKQAG